MGKLLKYLKDYKKECVLAPLFKMLEASFELFIPLVIAAMIDKGMGNSDKGFIIRSCGLLVLLALVGLISAITAQYFSAKAAVGFATEVRKDLFSHLLKLSFGKYDSLGSSTMITRMTSDVMQVQTGVNMFLRLTLRSPFVVLGAMVMAFTIDAKAALIFVVVIMILFAVVAAIMANNIPLLGKVQSGLDYVLRLTRENLIGARVLRAFAREDEEKASFNDATGDLYCRQIRAAKLSSLMNPVTYVIINSAIVCLIYVGAVRVGDGELSQGSVVALYNYMSQILVELIKLANMVVTLNKAIASGNRISSVMEIEEENDVSVIDELNDCVSSEDEAVVFDHVSFKYNEGGDETITDASFMAAKGDVIGIIGGTGAGKTTLVSLLAGFYAPQTGSISVFGRKINEYSTDTLRGMIGFVFQKASLFAGSIADNLKYGNPYATKEDMLEAMHLAVADDVIASKGDIDAYVGEAGKELSGGQRQRVTIARALVRKPRILIFDDSTSALDYATQARFISNLKNLEYKPTIFIVSQRTNAVINADKVIVMEDGCIVGTGTHSELLKTCSTYRQIHNSQFAGSNEMLGGESDESK